MNIQDINPLDVRSTASGSIPERPECMKMRSRDTPYNRAPTAIGGTTYRGLDLVCEVGERPKNILGKSSHGCPSAHRRLRHSRVIPLDVMSQEPDEIIEIPGVPGIHESLDHIC